MYVVASDIVKSGGLSAPAWVFFTTLVAGLLAIVGQLIGIKRKASDAATIADRTATRVENSNRELIEMLIESVNGVRGDLKSHVRNDEIHIAPESE